MSRSGGSGNRRGERRERHDFRRERLKVMDAVSFRARSLCSPANPVVTAKRGRRCFPGFGTPARGCPSPPASSAHPFAQIPSPDHGVKPYPDSRGFRERRSRRETGRNRFNCRSHRFFAASFPRTSPRFPPKRPWASSCPSSRPHCCSHRRCALARWIPARRPFPIQPRRPAKDAAGQDRSNACPKAAREPWEGSFHERKGGFGRRVDPLRSPLRDAGSSNPGRPPGCLRG